MISKKLCKRASIALLAIFVSYYLALSVLAHRFLGLYDFVDLHCTFYNVALYKNNKMNFEYLVISGTHKETYVDKHMKEQCKELVPLFWKCLFNPIQKDQITLDGNKLEYNLPPFTCTISAEPFTKRYATLTRGPDLTNADIASLDKAGWKYDDELSGSYSFKKNKYILGVNMVWELPSQGCIGEMYVHVSNE